MKKGLFAVLAIFTIFALTMVSCDTGGGGGKNWTVTFHDNKPTAASADVTGMPANITKQKDQTAIGAKTAPELTGYTFGGWYKEAAGTNVWDLANDPVVENLDLYAKWTPAGSQVENVTISFDANGGTGTRADATIAKGGTLNATQISGTGFTNTTAGKTKFLGWGKTATATVAEGVTFATTFDDDATLYVIWGADTDTPIDVGTEKVTISFDANGGTGNREAAVIDKDTGTLSAAQIAGTGFVNGTREFLGWGLTASATTYVTTTTTFAVSQSIYAIWAPEVVGDDDDDDDDDDDWIEEVALANSFFAIYEFKLPADTQWSYYEKITAQYMVDDEDKFDVSNSGRAIRLMGNYDPNQDFTFVTGVGAATGLDYAVAQYGSGNNPDLNKNGPFIMDNNPNGGWKPLREALEGELGECPAAGDWFTISYPIDGSRKNAEMVLPSRAMPAATDKGPFYFGLGLTGQDDENIFQIKNIRLVGREGVADVKATPVEFKVEGKTYQAFSGYGNAEGNFGYGQVYRYMETGEEFVSVVEITMPDVVEITFDLGSDPTAAFGTADIAGFDRETGIKEVYEGRVINTLPSATSKKHTLVGWSTTSGGTIKIEESFVVTKTTTTLYAIWELTPIRYPFDLGKFNFEGDNPNQLGWNSEDMDEEDYIDGDDSNAFDWRAIEGAKYLVIETKGGGAGTGTLNEGFGGFQVIVVNKNEDLYYGQNDVISGWLAFPHEADDEEAANTVWFVIDLEKLDDYEDFIKGPSGQLFIAVYPFEGLGFQGAWLYDELDNDMFDEYSKVALADNDAGDPYGFVAFPAEEEADDPTRDTILDLQAILADVAAGPIEDQEALDAIFGDNGLAGVGFPGNCQYEVIALSGGNKGLQVTTVASWAGLDIIAFTKDAEDNEVQILFEDDIITVAIKNISVPNNQFLLNMDHAGWTPLGATIDNLEEGSSTRFSRTLTDDNITTIQGASPQSFRLRGGNTGVGVFEVHQIKITRAK